MTAQVPERIIIDGRPHALHADPLYRLLASRRVDNFPQSASGWTTACWRNHIGTWELSGGRLHLLHLCAHGVEEEPLSEEVRRWFLRLVPTDRFPIPAHWFNGKLRIPLGGRLIYSHQGWSSWFERERVVTIRGGRIVRDREVDTQAIVERWLRRNEHAWDMLGFRPDESRPGRLIWPDESPDEDWDDWWPPDYPSGRVQRSDSANESGEPSPSQLPRGVKACLSVRAR